MQAGQSSRLAQSFGSTRQSLNVRPQHTVNADGNYFANFETFSFPSPDFSKPATAPISLTRRFM